MVQVLGDSSRPAAVGRFPHPPGRSDHGEDRLTIVQLAVHSARRREGVLTSVTTGKPVVGSELSHLGPLLRESGRPHQRRRAVTQGMQLTPSIPLSCILRLLDAAWRKRFQADTVLTSTA